MIAPASLAGAPYHSSFPRRDADARHHQPNGAISTDRSCHCGVSPGVLRRNDVTVGLHKPVDKSCCPGSIVGLHGNESDIELVLAGHKFVFVEVKHCRSGNERVVGTVHLQSVSANRFDLLVPHIDHRYIVSGVGQPSADIRADSSGTNKNDSLFFTFGRHQSFLSVLLSTSDIPNGAGFSRNKRLLIRLFGARCFQ